MVVRNGGVTLQTMEKNVQSGTDVDGGWAAGRVLRVLGANSRHRTVLDRLHLQQLPAPVSALG
jgi:hypothetical protein